MSGDSVDPDTLKYHNAAKSIDEVIVTKNQTIAKLQQEVETLKKKADEVPGLKLQIENFKKQAEDVPDLKLQNQDLNRKVKALEAEISAMCSKTAQTVAYEMFKKEKKHKSFLLTFDGDSAALTVHGNPRACMEQDNPPTSARLTRATAAAAGQRGRSSSIPPSLETPRE